MSILSSRPALGMEDPLSTCKVKQKLNVDIFDFSKMTLM